MIVEISRNKHQHCSEAHGMTIYPIIYRRLYQYTVFNEKECWISVICSKDILNQNLTVRAEHVENLTPHVSVLTANCGASAVL